MKSLWFKSGVAGIALLIAAAGGSLLANAQTPDVPNASWQPAGVATANRTQGTMTVAWFERNGKVIVCRDSELGNPPLCSPPARLRE